MALEMAKDLIEVLFDDGTKTLPRRGRPIGRQLRHPDRAGLERVRQACPQCRAAMGSIEKRQKYPEDGMRRHARVAQRGDPGLARLSFGAGDAPRCRMLMIRMPHPQRQDGYAGPAGEDHREDGTTHAGLDFGGDMRRPIGEFRKRVQREGCRIRSREAFECLADHGVPRCDRALASILEGDEPVRAFRPIEADRAGDVQCAQPIRAGNTLEAGCGLLSHQNRTAEQAPGQEVDVLRGRSPRMR
jgi:hypothetical protein